MSKSISFVLSLFDECYINEDFNDLYSLGTLIKCKRINATVESVTLEEFTEDYSNGVKITFNINKEAKFFIRFNSMSLICRFDTLKAYVLLNHNFATALLLAVKEYKVKPIENLELPLDCF